MPLFLRLVCFVLDLHVIEKEVSSPLMLGKWLFPHMRRGEKKALLSPSFRPGFLI